VKPALRQPWPFAGSIMMTEAWLITIVLHRVAGRWGLLR